MTGQTGDLKFKNFHSKIGNSKSNQDFKKKFVSGLGAQKCRHLDDLEAGINARQDR